MLLLDSKMTDQQVQHLANLLERAIGSVVVTHDRSKQQIDIPTPSSKGNPNEMVAS